MELSAEELQKIPWKALSHGACSLSCMLNELPTCCVGSCSALQLKIFCLLLWLPVLQQFFSRLQENSSIAEVSKVFLCGQGQVPCCQLECGRLCAPGSRAWAAGSGCSCSPRSWRCQLVSATSVFWCHLFQNTEESSGRHISPAHPNHYLAPTTGWISLPWKKGLLGT